MKHSVIVTVYNKEKYIEDTILSLINQTRKPHEIIIVDDCSSDRSFEILSKIVTDSNNLDSNLKLIRNETNKGSSFTRNTGLELVSGDCFSFLDGDDQYSTDYIETVNDIYEKHRFKMLFVQVISKNKKTVRPNIIRFQKYLEPIVDTLYSIPDPVKILSRESLFAGGGNVIIAKECLKNIRFDENSKVFEDWDFYFRILKSSFEEKYSLFLFQKQILEFYTDDVVDSLSKIKANNYKEFQTPKLVSDLKNSIDRNEISYRKFVVSAWVYNSLQRMGSFQHRFLFILNNKNIILRNFQINKYFLPNIFLIFFNNSKIKKLLFRIYSFRRKK